MTTLPPSSVERMSSNSTLQGKVRPTFAAVRLSQRSRAIMQQGKLLIGALALAALAGCSAVRQFGSSAVRQFE